MTDRDIENLYKDDTKFLTFELNKIGYGVDILRVREIMGFMPVTPIPRMPEAVLGVINLRGKVIPIVDFRTQLGLMPDELTDESCIVVLELKDTNGGGREIGVVVDSVNDVRNIKPSEMEPSPDFGSASNESGHIDAMAKCEDGVKVIVNIDRIFNGNDLSALATAV